MPIHIEEMTNEVTVVDGELPLSEAQIQRLAAVVLQRLNEQRQQEQQQQETSVIRRKFVPHTGIEG